GDGPTFASPVLGRLAGRRDQCPTRLGGGRARIAACWVRTRRWHDAFARRSIRSLPRRDSTAVPFPPGSRRV
ncbi:MAG: hypothetical protein AVDCRST_MAG73-3599, partial [uncultured Thermomicrobiales bacterium]